MKIVDEDYFLKSIVSDIGNDVASDSIYDYLEKVLNLNISYSSKSITFEPFDEQAYQLFGDVSVAYSATVRSIVYLEIQCRFNIIFQNILQMNLNLMTSQDVVQSKQ